MLFQRLRCHFCGAKQSYDRKVPQFQCAQCDAVNFLDGRGNIIDTPVDAVSSARSQTFSSPGLFARGPQTPQYQPKPTFCRTCIKNQHLYNETLANYLPDEDHPKYHDFERKLPKFKKELEQRYPLICKACAPKAQDRINRADYYGMSQNAAQLMSTTRARGGRTVHGQRDDLFKRTMRILLFLTGCAANLGFLIQAIFHVYGIGLAMRNSSEDLVPEDDIQPRSLSTCATGMLSLQFSPSCYFELSNAAQSSILLALGLLWYNPSLRKWFHATDRIEAIVGQRNFYISQVIILAVRVTGYYNLVSTTTLTTLTPQELIGRHVTVISIMSITQIFAWRTLKPILWRIRGKIMPRPDEVDVLGGSAGPAKDHHVPQASANDPFRYLNGANHAPTERHLNGGDLASSFSSASHTNAFPYDNTAFPPSSRFLPSSTASNNDDIDMMDIDSVGPRRPSAYDSSTKQPRIEPRTFWYNHSNAAPLGFNTVAHEIGDIEGKMRREQQQRAKEQDAKLHWQPRQPSSPSQLTLTQESYQGDGRPTSPFYGTLPAAPMTMAQRLRQTPGKTNSFDGYGKADTSTSVNLPPSSQQDFMARMRAGIRPLEGDGRNVPDAQTSQWSADVRPGTLVLPGDVRELSGLEDRFFSTVSLSEEEQARNAKSTGGWLNGLFG